MTSDSTPTVSLSSRLSGVRVGLRDDLTVSRHVFRGQPAYVVTDPITFQNQRLDLCDYDVLTRLRSDVSLGDIFTQLVKEGRLGEGDEELFYAFVVNLHRLGFLQLPVSDDKLLYRRFEARRQAARRGRWASLLYLRVPLWNPDAFLRRTVVHVRPLFSVGALALWIALVLSALWLAWSRRADLGNPLQGLLVAGNAPLLVLTLIVLKVFHEFGHAYACRHFGGAVPEMGAYFILFTPCAYVDATASWSFARKRDRMIVCLAGMYVEIAIAAAAVWVWAMTSDSLLRSLCYNIMFLAGSVTVLFNINPLMRYDGYYLLSDWLEIPNLRQRAARHVGDALKRVLLGVRGSAPPVHGRLAWTLLSFGLASAWYRVMLTIAIVAVLASKSLWLGVIVGGGMLLKFAGALTLRLTSYLWYSDETAGVRARAVALSLIALIALPTGIMMIPLPSSVRASAVVEREYEDVVRVRRSGFVEAVNCDIGDAVVPSRPLVSLSSLGLVESVQEAEATLRSSEIRLDALLATGDPEAEQEKARLAAHRLTLAERRRGLNELSVRASAPGEVVEALRPRDIGRLLNEGEQAFVVASGGWRVRAWLTAEEFGAIQPRVGDTVQFRPRGAPSTVLGGTIERVAPGGSNQFEFSSITQLSGGAITVDPVSGKSTEPYFEVVVSLANPEGAVLRRHMTGVARLEAGAEAVGTRLARQVVRFWNKLLAG